MLRLRVISAVILLPLVIAGILFLPTLWVAVASGIVFALAAWEWIHLTVLNTNKIRFVLLALLILIAYMLLANGFNLTIVYGLSLIWWVCGFIGICYFPRGEALWRELFFQPVIGLILFVPAWLAFNQLHGSGSEGPIWVLLGCCLVWGADVGAYFSGKLWGNSKMCPNVSPGKTWAGFCGALGAGVLIMSIFYVLYKPHMYYVYAIWLALVTVLFAVLGDLVESMLKRVYKVKDSGTLIPGHGGAFDRIDSMLAAFPIYVLGLQIIASLRIMAV